MIATCGAKKARKYIVGGRRSGAAYAGHNIIVRRRRQEGGSGNFMPERPVKNGLVKYIGNLHEDLTGRVSILTAPQELTGGLKIILSPGNRRRCGRNP